MKRIAWLLLLVGFSFSGCGEDTPIIPADVDPTSVTVQIGSELITPQYFEFDGKIGDLLGCINAFEASRTPQSLDAARQCWRDAHAAWERTEAFLIGPALKEKLSSHVDSFPVVVADIKHKLIVTPPPISKANVQWFDGTTKGFHTIEFLLWGETGTKQLSEFSDSEFYYLNAATAEMWERSDIIRNAWDPNRGDYNQHFINAGQGTSDFASSKEVVRAMLIGMANACYDLADRKLGKPLDEGIEFEESHFSGNSATDYHNTLIGVQNLYLGGTTETGYSIAALIVQKNFELEARIRSELTNALKAVSDLGPSFAQTLANNPGAVQTAKEAVRVLARSLMEDAMIITN